MSNTKRSKLGEAESDTWFKNHFDKSKKNHEGSVGAMEPQSMLKVFCHSQAKHGLVYEGYLGVGDSKMMMMMIYGHFCAFGRLNVPSDLQR